VKAFWSKFDSVVKALNHTEKRVMRIGCVVAQRNEEDCLEPWVRYHSYLFGMENVFIIDNASDSPIVQKQLERYEALGVQVTRIPPGTDFATRGEYTANLIKSVTTATHYDFFFPLDCDEFIYVVDPSGTISCNRHDIENHLASFVGTPDILLAYEAMENVNKSPGVYFRRTMRKVFFSGDTCEYLDLGFHVARSKSSDKELPTKIGYIHFHWRPYEIYMKLARAKMAPFVDVNDREALANYRRGPNWHLAQLMLLTPEQYDEHLKKNYAQPNGSIISFSQFSSILKMIGVRPEFIDGQGWMPRDEATV
jgi:hypothetical protein